ncbi:MAG: protein translocase subunit SecF, partial [Gammaproteobacteria bacterium]|nr:protein translocase subunit SecF [Gammaproteobacteria bacterium]
IGYSLNDTIVVFDRIRENFRKLRRLSPTAVVNDAINQTLGRTVMTSTTTLLTMVALFVAGGDLIRNFSLAMIIGIAIGTYSSIFVASNIALQLGLSRQDLVRAEPEHEENAREERRRPG